MINNKRVLAIIPARGGSKGLPGKNIIPVAGRPLVAWTIDAARQASHIDQIILSSDDDEIIKVAREYGCEVPFKRPEKLATDTATSIDVVVHALNQLPDYELVVLLQPTSPLRTGQDIEEALELLNSTGAPSCVSVCTVEESPYWMYRLDEKMQLRSVLQVPEGGHRRQDLPSVYSLNGAIYIARVDWLRETRSFLSPETVAYVMPRQRSIDIDTIDDLAAFRRTVGEDV